MSSDEPVLTPKLTKKRKAKLAYAIIDCEYDGPIPGIHSLLSVAIVVVIPTFRTRAWKEASRLVINFKTLPDASTDPVTMKFWDSNPEAWDACRQGAIESEKATKALYEHILSIKARWDIITVAWPIHADVKWLDYYFYRFCGLRDNPLGPHFICAKSYLWSLTGLPSPRCNMEQWFRHYGRTHTHPHIAVIDAEEQSGFFMRMLISNVHNTYSRQTYIPRPKIYQAPLFPPPRSAMPPNLHPSRPTQLAKVGKLFDPSDHILVPV